jgi:hypothetical protein
MSAQHKKISRYKRSYNFMQDVSETGKKGALRAQLRIPKSKKIPCTLLNKIKTTRIGAVIDNPTQIGKQEMRVTRLLKRRAVMALLYKRAKGGCA